MSDALIGYYTVLRKTRKWYRSLFYHFVDIAVVNAFIIQQQLAKMKQKKAKSQREFREALVSQLADWMPPPAPPASSATPAPPDSQHACHKPKHISNSKRAFRRKCRMCHMKHQSSALPVMLLSVSCQNVIASTTGMTRTACNTNKCRVVYSCVM